MDTKQLLDFINNNEEGDDANDILFCFDSRAEKRIATLISKLSKEIKAIKKEFPDAFLRANDYSIDLYLGDEYTRGEQNYNEVAKPDTHNHELIAQKFFISELLAVKS